MIKPNDILYIQLDEIQNVIFVLTVVKYTGSCPTGPSAVTITVDWQRYLVANVRNTFSKDLPDEISSHHKQYHLIRLGSYKTIILKI